MTNQYQDARILKDKTQIKCCRHKRLVPLEVGLASKTYPNGYNEEPYYNFAVNLLSANVLRIRSYICLDCKREIKAPNPGSLDKDRL